MKTLIIVVLAFVAIASKSETLILYQVDELKPKYLLSRTHHEDNSTSTSEIVLAETLSVDVKGQLCQLTMSNAYVYRTSVHGGSLSATNAIDQDKMFVGKLTVTFLKSTKVIFNSELMDISQIDLTANGQQRKVESEGNAAEKGTEKVDQKPSPDADIKQ